MVDRVVLGSGSLAHTLVESLTDRPGTLRIVTDDADRLDTLRGDDRTVLQRDPTDPATLASLDPDPELVVVADADAETNLAAARHARASYPAAQILGYTGDEGGDATAMARYADRVLDPAGLTAEFVLARVGDEGVRMRGLRRKLRSMDSLAIVTHDNPDPDAIASAVALARIARASGCDAEVVYFGTISHQENRAFVNLLNFDLTALDDGDALEEFDGVALVDHSRPGVNDQLPEDLAVDVVIDHHPPRLPVEADFVDLRSHAGATSTLLVEYLEQYDVAWEEDLATGLLFGIRVDTHEFTRQVSPADFEAAATLLPHADLALLERIESPSVSPETLRVIAAAIANRQREGAILLSCVGDIGDRDALAQAADQLLELEGVSTTVVYGYQEGTIYVSARSRGTDVDLGDTLRDAFGQIGSAGGHADMAGAQLALGVLEAVDEREESLSEIVESVVADRFLEALEARTEQTVTEVFAPSEGGAEEYLVPEEERPPPEGGDPPAEDGEDAPERRD
jgi:nanoRNase/pAp phosphatase (c-di-AMP/oligoRNAs hydrolase)